MRDYQEPADDPRVAMAKLEKFVIGSEQLEPFESGNNKAEAPTARIR